MRYGYLLNGIKNSLPGMIVIICESGDRIDDDDATNRIDDDDDTDR